MVWRNNGAVRLCLLDYITAVEDYSLPSMIIISIPNLATNFCFISVGHLNRINFC
jgi:hypothetical protein